MCATIDLQVVFGLDYIHPGWHLAYGVRTNLWEAILRDDKKKFSFFHTPSEGALTFFILGRLDYWSQVACFDCLPRLDDGHEEGWNPEFFSNIVAGRPNYRPAPTYSKLLSSWGQHLPQILNVNSVSLDESALLFEFDTGAGAFNPDAGVPLPYSFLDLGESGKGHRYDAVLILPKTLPKKTFIFFECKLGSDIGLTLDEWPFVNQFVRALESAYFLTAADESPYRKEWDFRYVIVAPGDVLDKKMTHYTHLVADPREHLRLYREFIQWRYPERVVSERMRLYDHFVDTVCPRIVTIPWDVLARSLPYFSVTDYLSRLPDAGLHSTQIEAIRERFRLAGVPLG